MARETAARRRVPPALRPGPPARVLPLVPALFLLLAFFAGPVLWTVWASFTDAALTGAAAARTEFVGLRNFERLLTDPDVLNATVLTAVFLIGSGVVGQTVLGLALALLMQGRRGWVRGAVGGVVVGAWVLPEVVAGFVWAAFLEREGTLNLLLQAVGAAPQSWLTSLPILAVVLANVWKGTAFSMMAYSAALAEVPGDLKEAARVDGAGTLRVVWHVVLPLLRRTIAATLLLVTLQTVQVFTLIFVMTGGGPGGRSTTLPLLMYQEALGFGDIGYGTAVGLALLVVAGLFSAVYLRTLRPEEVR
ncbi:multiple sugar transport system permease protein [Nocardiopsis composta]|uniref:Multiple sugar transport system permease protein n=1 Tax=Nocardiopsis composta TaxID=157465 RepID=A0A7W8QME0_9ACTN|nr:multiple sugar transport system permease protein [Nocardiopsis composta]